MDIDLQTSPVGLKDIGLIHTFNKIILGVVWLHSGFYIYACDGN